jgi:hypothetical protein
MISQKTSKAFANDVMKSKRGEPKIKRLDFYNWEYKMNQAAEQA